MVSTAARVGSINVLLQTDISGGVRGLNAFAGAVDRTGAGVTRSVAGIDRTIGGLNRSLGNINTRGMTSLTLGALRAGTALDSLRGFALAAGVAIGGLMPAAIAASMIRTADGAHRLTNQLRTVTSSAADLKNTQQELFDVAQRSRSSFEATTTIYARTARAVEHLNMKQKDLLRMTETVQKAFAVGGATTAEAWGGAVQLSQGIASNRFSGDEFRSVAENAPVLLQGMAKHLGVTIGKLREMAHAGQLTADVVTRAIIGASADIDEAFAKTTSTIEQAWTRVGNAVTKYAMDSKQADAASLIIVGTLNMLAENVGYVATALSLLGIAMVSALGVRAMSSVAGGIRAVTTETAKAREQLKLAAQEALKAAQAEAAANATRLASAKAYYNTVTQGVATEKTRHRASQALYKANLANAASQNALTAATQQYDEAVASATKRAVALSAAQRTGGFLLGPVGGAPGAALLAILGSVAMIGSAMSNADAATEDWKKSLRDAGLLAEDAADKAAAIDEAIKTGNTTRLREELAKVNVELDRIQHGNLWDRLTGKLNNFDAIISDVAGGIMKMSDAMAASERAGLKVSEELAARAADYQRFQQLVEIVREAGGMTAEVRDEMQKLADKHSDLDPLLSSLDKIAPVLEAGSEQARRLEDDLARLDGTEVNIRINYSDARTAEDASMKALGDMQTRGEAYERQAKRLASMTKAEKEFADEVGRVRKELERREAYLPDAAIKDIARANIAQQESFKTPKKTPAPRKTADDRFDNSVQAIYDRIEALRLEREMLGATYYEQVKREEALKLEQEALKQAREEARRKGDADWQNAQISAEKRAEIEKVTAALAEEADAHRKATEAMQLQKDIMKDVLSGLREALADGKITWEELGDIALRVLDKIVSKIEDELIDAIFAANKAGSAGGGGGLFGWLGKLFGLGGGASLSPAASSVVSSGGMTGLFDSGGVHLGGNVVPFGPKTKKIGAGIIADSGFGVRHFPAILEKGEAVLTEDMMSRTMNVVSAAANSLHGTRQQIDVMVYVKDDGTLGAIARQAGREGGAEAADIRVSTFSKRELPYRMDEINRNPRLR